MDRQPSPLMANQCPAVRDAAVLKARGTQHAWAQRERRITPWRLGRAVVASMATPQGQTMAALPRPCHALWAFEAEEQACDTPRRTSRSPACFRAALGPLRRQRTRPGLGVAAGAALRACHRLLLPEGSACALPKALAAGGPGRSHAVLPAAVARHGPWPWRPEAPSTMALRPAPDAAHASRPAPERRRGAGCLAARGALALPSGRDLDRHGGCWMVRRTAQLPPRVMAASRADGPRLPSGHERDCPALTSPCPPPQRAALAGEGLSEGAPLRGRLRVRWTPATPGGAALCTHRPPAREPLRILGLGDQRSWPGALLWPAWTASTHLRQGATDKATLGEAWLWAALAASARPRVRAQAAEHRRAVVRSTRQASLPSASDGPQRWRALRYGHGPWSRRAFQAMIPARGSNATRAPPERDARTGRSRLGRKPIKSSTRMSKLFSQTP